MNPTSRMLDYENTSILCDASVGNVTNALLKDVLTATETLK